MVTRTMPRVQEVLLPILRAELPGVSITGKLPPVAFRDYPLVNIRRIGGSAVDMRFLDRPTLEVLAVTDGTPVDAENLYLDVRQAIFDAVDRQTVVEGVGHLHSFAEQMGPTPFDSPYSNTWGVQGLIQVGLRPRRS